jgi:transposase
MSYDPNECYTIAEVSDKFGVSLSTVNKTIRRLGVPRRQIGKYVYVPKEQINKIFSNK